jgi:branched-chain amino acid transport system substrate-binding protein
MENNKKTFKYIGLLAVVVVIVVVLFVQYKPVDNSVVKVGVILPLSGDLAFIGEPAKHGAEMALESFGETKHKYELIFEDDQFDGKKAVTAANKLISIDKVNAIVTFGSSGGNSVKPIAEANNIIHFAVASDQKIADGVINFNHWTSPREEVRAMVDEFVNRGIKTVSILTMNQDGMIAIADELKSQLKNTGIEIVGEEKFNVGTRDFRTISAKLKEKLPEIIVMVNYSPELEVLGRQIRDAGINTPMTSFEGLDATTDAKLFAGSWYSTASDMTDKFKTEFKAKYNLDPIVGTGNVYDIVSFVVTASENIKGQVNTDKLGSSLVKIKDFVGSMGIVSIGADGAVVSPAVIKTVK